MRKSRFRKAKSLNCVVGLLGSMCFMACFPLSVYYLYTSGKVLSGPGHLAERAALEPSSGLGFESLNGRRTFGE